MLFYVVVARRALCWQLEKQRKKAQVLDR